MQHHPSRLPIVVLTACLALASGVWLMQATAFVRAAPVKTETPVVTGVSPDAAPNDVDTDVTIHGSGFSAVLSGTQVITPPAVWLGDTFLAEVTWADTRTLTATVPWGLDARVYDVTVVNPDGGAGSLPQAFTVTQALGVWNTGGPYGGQIRDLAVSPVTSRTAFAVSQFGGLFYTENGGDWWQAVPASDAANGIVYGPAPAYPIYFWGPGLQRSDDGGQTWTLLVSQGVGAFALDPQNPSHLWIGTNADVQFSTDGGQTWTVRNTGLPSDSPVNRLAINPSNPDVLYAGLHNAHLYRTIDGGLHWALSEDGMPAPLSFNESIALAVDPFAPDIVLFSRMHSYELGVFRSIDGGAHWIGIADPLGTGGQGFVSDLAFSTQVSGTVYASMMADARVGVSHDGGLSWTPVYTQSADHLFCLGMDPASDEPIYFGGWTIGAYRRIAGTHTMELATGGITGVYVREMDASFHHPETAYASAEVPVYVTENLGHAWRIEGPSAAQAVAVDPDNPERAYMAWSDFYRKLDAASGWETVHFPVTITVRIPTIAIDPVSSNILYAGGENSTAGALDINQGLLFRSDDYGATWTELSLSREISMVRRIAVDPVNPDYVYAAADAGGRGMHWVPAAGLGVFRSSDGGATWESIAHEMGPLPSAAIAIRPDRPQVLLAGGLNADHHATVFYSDDRGESWQSTDLLLDWAWVTDLVIDPLNPDRVYASSEEGLYCSVDGGLHWEPWDGWLGQVEVWSLAIATDGLRTVLYAGAQGGLVTVPAGPGMPAGTLDIQAGVYQISIRHYRSYLPVARR